MKRTTEASPTAERYVKDVAKRLICPKGTKKFFMQQFKDMVCSYVAEHPDASYEDLQKEFGAPEKLSTDIVEKDEYREMLKKAKTKVIFLIIFGVIAVFVIAFLIWFIAYLIKRYGGTYTVSSAYIDTVSVTASVLERFLL